MHLTALSNGTSFAIELCGCCITPNGWQAWQAQDLSVFSGFVVIMQFILLGFFLADNMFSLFVINVLTVWFVYFALLPLQRVIEWMRPVYSDPNCIINCGNSYFFSMINAYAFPEPLLVTGIVMWIVFVFVRTRNGRPFPYLIAIVLIVLYIGAGMSEVTLQRETVGQLFANLGVSAAIGLTMIFLAEIFYEVFQGLKYDQRAWRRLFLDLETGDVLSRVESVYEQRPAKVKE